MNPHVSIIIVNYNGKEVLDKCVSSIFSSSYYPLEVILVDNCSNDGSDLEVAKKYDVTLIKNKTNLYFCRGSNIGVRRAKGKYIMFLNHDIILDREAISELMKEALRSKNSGFFQPKILLLDKPNILNSTGLDIHLAGFGILRGGGEVDLGQYDNLTEIPSVHGACFLASKEALEDTGLFDEFFVAFNEDTDIGWRALLKGWRPRYVPSAKVYHKWGQSWGSIYLRQDKLYYVERNRIILLLTNYETRTLILFLPILILAELSTLFYCLIHKSLKIKVRTYADIIRSTHYILKRRKYIQANRRVNDRYIISKFTYKFNHPFLAESTKLLKILNLLFKLFSRVLFIYEISKRTS
ncbi:MAG: glycosyltransferase family 2 protein [Nitrososphaerales archaeon]